MKELLSFNPEKLLIRSTNWIGDAVMTTPAVRTIRKNFPTAEISILAYPWVADVFRASPDVDRVIPYEKDRKHPVRNIREISRKVAAEGFSMAILLQHAFEAAMIAWLSRIPVRAGYRKDGRGLLLTHGVAVRREIRAMHQVHYYQDLCFQLGMKKGPDQLGLVLPPDAIERAAKRSTNYGTRPIVGLNPGAAYGPAKRWPEERFAELAIMLKRDLDAMMLVFGTDADRKAAETIVAAAPGNVDDLTGRTKLVDAMALIGACDAFVTNDSGLMHVAAALSTPLVAIFGSTDPVATGPYSDNAVVVQQKLACAPCFKTHCKSDFECMIGISAAEIFAHVRGMVNT